MEPDCRGRGFGTQLIQDLASGDSPIWPRRTTMITLETQPTNQRAKALYERLGFKTRANHVLTLRPASPTTDAAAAPKPG